MKIGQYLTKLCVKYGGLLFCLYRVQWLTGCTFSNQYNFKQNQEPAAILKLYAHMNENKFSTSWWRFMFFEHFPVTLGSCAIHHESNKHPSRLFVMACTRLTVLSMHHVESHYRQMSASRLIGLFQFHFESYCTYSRKHTHMSIMYSP